jgi:hypothetical protein
MASNFHTINLLLDVEILLISLEKNKNKNLKSEFHKLHRKNRKIQSTKNYRMRKIAWFAHHKIIWIKKKIIYFWERETCLNQPNVFSGFLDEKMWSNQKEIFLT